jgi:hypothetical protein
MTGQVTNERSTVKSYEIWVCEKAGSMTVTVHHVKATSDRDAWVKAQSFLLRGEFIRGVIELDA